MPFGVRQIPVINITSPGGLTVHPFARDGSVDVVATLADPNAVLTITDTRGTHLYPVRHIYSATLGHSADQQQASVELWQSADMARLFIRDPESPNAYELIGKHADGHFGRVAANLTHGVTHLVDGDTMRLRRGLDGLELVATWRPDGVQLHRENETLSLIAGPEARRFANE